MFNIVYIASLLAFILSLFPNRSIIDELTPSQVHVLSNSHLGFTSSKRLDEHPDVEWAKQTLTTGEFWDAEGEDWVVDGETND